MLRIIKREENKDGSTIRANRLGNRPSLENAHKVILRLPMPIRIFVAGSGSASIRMVGPEPAPSFMSRVLIEMSAWKKDKNG